MPLKQTLSRHWFTIQRELFPWLEEALGPLGERYERLVRVLELVRVEEWLPYSRACGRAASSNPGAGAGGGSSSSQSSLPTCTTAGEASASESVNRAAQHLGAARARARSFARPTPQRLVSRGGLCELQNRNI